jgi:hypothetical protein
MLLAGAGLLGISLERAMDVSPRFRSDHILTGKISLPSKSYSDDVARVAFTEKLVDKTGDLPGVLSTGVVTNVPFSGISGKSAATIQGRAPQPGESPHGYYSYGVGGDYFKAMGFSLLEVRPPIHGAISESASWTGTSLATTGPAAVRSAITCSRVASRAKMRTPSGSSALLEV